MILENSVEVFECGGFVLWGCSPHAPGNIGCCIPSDALAGIKASHIRRGSLYMGACVAPMPPCKHRAFNSKFCPSGIKLAHIFCEKAEQNIFFSLLFSCAARRNLGCNIPCCRRRGASSPTNRSPHIQKPLRQFSKYSKLFFQRFLHLFYARKGTIWD